ncbi:cytochrome P450 (plasmid) [Roseivivax marinus]|uniref:cytochrome P450 n=1 Tax=Roseivivax marinus TaxID=1379903 RepID=UPI001F03877A|nr:cytochrome P450 [Roseivivax marinus]UMA67124.1 cytochrome P450 [Roseivivax marinus]
MTGLPRESVGDSTLSLLREGYEFVSRRCEKHQSDAFRTRLLGRDVICLRGPRAVALLYGTAGLKRRGAMPWTVLNLLQGPGSVGTLEGEAHRQRKSLFVSLMAEGDAADQLACAFEAAWAERLVFEATPNALTTASDVLARVVTEWAGLGEELAGDPRFRRDLFLMSDQAGRFGPGVVHALWRRSRAERRIHEVLDAGVDTGTPADFIVRFEEGGRPLPRDVAVREILNILRPVVAVGRHVAFAARILVRDPEWRDWLRTVSENEMTAFAEEVRRTSPFFPATTAITTERVDLDGLTLQPGQWVMADLWGTMQLERCFPAPEVFIPGRSLDRRRADACFVPQGGGDIATSHRCPGDRTSVALITAALRVLCRHVTWRAPEQDLRIFMSRMPAKPANGVDLTDVAPER